MNNELLGRFRVSRRFLDPQKEDNVLSIGCKEAVLESHIAGEVNSITAFDIDSDIIDANAGKIPGITFEYGDIVRGTGYPEESFDKILFLEVLEHLPVNTEDQALSESYRLLKTGGTMVISTPNDTAAAAVMDPAHWLIGHRHYKPSAVRGMLEKAGFAVEEEYVGGGIIEMVWIPFFYLLLRLRLAGFVQPLMDKIIDTEYNKPGFYTVIFKCRK
ncbi:class I SAM-dependent methyltransferase [Candidatus Latescibacterota bacterium]